MPRGSLVDSANVGPSSSAAQDWDLFGKYLSEQEKENFDIPDRASAFYVNIKRSLLSNLLVLILHIISIEQYQSRRVNQHECEVTNLVRIASAFR